MTRTKSRPKFHRLEIVGRSARSEIWLGDDAGFLVQREVGILNSLLLPGEYVVEFTLGGNCYPLHVAQDLRITQDEIELGPTIERPVPKFAKEE